MTALFGLEKKDAISSRLGNSRTRHWTCDTAVQTKMMVQLQCASKMVFLGYVNSPLLEDWEKGNWEKSLGFLVDGLARSILARLNRGPNNRSTLYLHISAKVFFIGYVIRGDSRNLGKN